MSYDLSIVVPQNIEIDRNQLANELHVIFKAHDLVDEVTIPTRMSGKHIMGMLETVMFPYYPNVKEQYQAFCQQNDYQEEPLEAKVAIEFWALMTAGELASVALRSHHSDEMVKSLYAQLTSFVKQHNLAIFNPQLGELENLDESRDYPYYWLEEE